MIWEKIKELEEKQQQLEFQIKKLEEMLKTLPNGHLEIKEINGRKYYYLRYWEEGRLKSKYIGKNASEIESKLKQAFELRSQLSLLKQEKEKIDRILNRIYKIIDENING
ncbi:hypothetical protein EWF20_13000 [Sulfolobus sp. S-194]|uniref:hypothetical protein n=1 Tax=Sulfolobus sp. S-194 TaxID=2512240 RepID=UPI001436FE89|nr:hypothetical protein [Sulfolobus sp. S-194]QIW24954.1 hypothetical protein EWF20_13000 [Sulfolobus sp. S-194]